MMTTLDIQRRLLALGYALPKFGADGDMGGETRAAVRKFQEDYGLVVDGDPAGQTQIALLRAGEAAKTAQAEPVKTAMAGAVPSDSAPGMDVAVAPPNVGDLILRDTSRPIDEIIIHCTATAEGKDYTVDDVRAWHKARGWSDVGYHYIVYRDGRIVEGRPVGQTGAHVADHNTGTIGISYVGGVSADGKTAKDTRTAAQRASLLWLVASLRAKHRGVRKVTGHNQYVAKACPSFDVRKDALSRVGL